jgi:FkbH-like protein
MVAESGGLLSSFERYISAPGGDRRTHFLAFRKLLKESILSAPKQASSALRRAITPTMDYTTACDCIRLAKRLQSHVSAPVEPVRIAIVGSGTTTQLAELIGLFCFSKGLSTDIYESAFGVGAQDILDAESGLYEHEPHVVFIASSFRELRERPDLEVSRSEVDRLAEKEVNHWQKLWQTLHDRTGCLVVQNNFDRPPWQPLGNFEVAHPAGRASFLNEVNRNLARTDLPFVVIHDLSHISACSGRWNWADQRFYHHAKLPCAPELLVDYAHSVASIIIAGRGLSKKCLVLDLDNTLWGGVIGDDGVGGIRLGQGDAEGEAYIAFQRYVLDLQERGVILAVCSKNEDDAARIPFLEHPEMLLKLDHIACFVANWNDKATNIARIANELNIGTDSLVFVDDNPAERSVVRQFLPNVEVPEMPADAAKYVETLDRHRYFQTLAISSEDRMRTEYYRSSSQRQVAESSATDIEDYLASLEMKASIAPISEFSLQRAAQLTNKSNQFNLTTRRYTAAEISARVESEDWVTRVVSLSDRFGDNGLISVLLARRIEGRLVIDTWLMSCRVLKRGVEKLLLDHLCGIAQDFGMRAIDGEYIPTQKNRIVAQHYEGLGFVLQGTAANGGSTWRLDIQNWSPGDHHITEIQT